MKQVMLLGGALAVALIGSYLTWTDDGEGEIPEGTVPVYDAAPDSVTGVSWKSDSLDVVVSRKTDDKGAFYEVEITERTEKKAPTPPQKAPADASEDAEAGAEGAEGEEGADEGEDAEAPLPEPEITTTVTRFVGQDAAEKLFESLEPLVAIRPLSIPDGKTAADFGFDDPSATMEVATSGGTVNLVLGQETFGTKDHIVENKGNYFLVEAPALRPLQFGKTRLLERNLHPFNEKDLAAVVVTQGPQSVTLTQQTGEEDTETFWAQQDTPDLEHPTAGAWLSKVLRMRAKNQVAAADVPEGLESAFTLALSDGEANWTVDVLKIPGDDKRVFARTDYLRGHVELTASLANDALLDINNVFAPE